MVEYRIEKVTVPMEQSQLQNDWGIDGWKLVMVMEYDEELWYHFERS